MDQQIKASAQVPARFNRRVSYLSIGVCVLTLVFVVSEFRLDWYESLIGSYLAATNDVRPEIGAVWEDGQNRVVALQVLDEVIARKEEVRITAGEVQSFSLLFSRLNSGEWVTLQPGVFKTMYRALPSSLARKMITTADLVWLLKGGQLERIFCEKSGQAMDIYFIDSENRVLHWITLDPQMFARDHFSPAVLAGRLEEAPGFAGQIYPSKIFFKALRRLPEDMASGLIQDQDLILDQTGTLERVGIWNQSDAGVIRIGFEFKDRNHYRIVFVRAREWAVWQLGLILKGAVQ